MKRTYKRVAVLLAAAAVAGLLIFVLGSPGAGATPAASANLSVTKSDRPDPIVSGNLLTYTVEVRNSGPDAAANVVMTDDLPGSVEFVSADATPTPPTPCEKKSGKVVCELGAVANDDTATVTIEVMVTKKKGTITNAASVTSDVPDPQAGNNLDTAMTTVKESPKPPKPKKCGGRAATIVGTRGDDALAGTDGGDVIVTLGGNDRVLSRRGSDIVCTGPGLDRVKAGRGADTVQGGGASDRLRGKRGSDHLLGEGGSDKLRGNRGPDLLEGGASVDRCKGGKGRDALRTCELGS